MNIDDTKLTAYALNELDEAERTQVEALLADDTEARRHVEEIRATATMLSTKLAAVPTPALTTQQRETISAAAGDPVSVAVPALSYEPVIHRPSFWRRSAKWALAAAACAALVAGGYGMYVRDVRTRAQVADLRATRDKMVEERHKLNVDLTDTLSKLEESQRSLKQPPTVADLIQRSQELIRRRKYNLALISLDAILTLEPSNDYAKGAYPLVYDQYQLLARREGGDTLDWPKGLNLAEERKIPYEDILRYPENWPGISEPSTSTSTFGSTMSGAINANTSGQRLPAGGQTDITFAQNPFVGVRRDNIYVHRAQSLRPVDPKARNELTETERQILTGTITEGAKSTPGTVAVATTRPQIEGRVPAMMTIRKQEVEFRAKLNLTKAREAIAAGDHDEARRSLGNAKVVILADAALLTPQELTALKGDVAAVEAEVTAPANESYAQIHDNPFKPVITEPLSTFSIDVDTASYSNIRRFINQGQLPPPDAVRIEEMLNYFPYDYKKPAPNSPDPFLADVEVAGCPWNQSSRLVRVAVKGKAIAHDKRPVSNLVFLIDVSGSMNEPRKLPLVKEGMKLLVNELTENDRVGIVVYAGAAGLVLPSTPADPKNKEKILAAIDNLSAGGSTNGGQGVELAYRLATENFIKGGTNRVLLATDGDWNVGITDQSSLIQLIEEKAKSGVFLSLLGFGFGNLKDSTLEKLADKGNGHYAYIDDVKEARKVFVEEMSGTLVTIAKDVKVQIEFNPTRVESYRLIGYENRILRKEDFNNDKIDAGEIGAGHAVTALYEVVPVKPVVAVVDNRDLKTLEQELALARKAAALFKPGSAEYAAKAQEAKKLELAIEELKKRQAPVDELKYQKTTVSTSPELLTLKLRYKQPEGDTSKLIEIPATDAGTSYARSSDDFKFSAAVAQFGMILRNSPHKGTASLDGVIELADEGKGKDDKGYRGEFVELVKTTKALVKK